MKRTLSFVLALLLMIGLAGCGAQATDKNSAVMAPEEYMEAPADQVLTDQSTTQGTDVPQNLKIIRTLEMDAETEDLDTLLSGVEARLAELGGYTESKSVYRGSQYSGRAYRYAHLTLRIPAEQADAFVQAVETVSNLTSTNETTQDVTLSYVATESRILALETEQTRLLELLEQAENMEDLLLIEQRLTDVRAELEEVNSQLRVYDNKINYTTIHLNIQEVKEFTPVQEETFWQRIGNGFVNSCKGLWKAIREVTVFVIVALPYLVPVAGVAVLVIVLARKARKTKKEKKNRSQE